MTRVLQQRAGELGVRLHLDAPIAALEPSRDRVLLRRGEHEQVYEGAVIASGSGSDLAQQCGLSAPTSPYAWGALNGMISVADWQWPTILHQRMHGPRKLFGLMPCSYTGAQLDIAMFWSLPVARHAQWQASDLEAWKAELVRFWPQSRPVVDQIRDHSQFGFATYRHAWPKRLAQGRICLVGDAAHAMSPQLGLGSTLAMGDALALARAAPHGRHRSGVPGLCAGTAQAGAGLPAAVARAHSLFPGGPAGMVARSGVRAERADSGIQALDAGQRRRLSVPARGVLNFAAGVADGFRDVDLPRSGAASVQATSGLSTDAAYPQHVAYPQALAHGPRRRRERSALTTHSSPAGSRRPHAPT